MVYFTITPSSFSATNICNRSVRLSSVQTNKPLAQAAQPSPVKRSKPGLCVSRSDCSDLDDQTSDTTSQLGCTVGCSGLGLHHNQPGSLHPPQSQAGAKRRQPEIRPLPTALTTLSLYMKMSYYLSSFPVFHIHRY